MGFNEWWSIYPRKVAKMAAEKAYQQQIKKGFTDAELLAGLHRFTDLLKWRGTGMEFVPHAATWLRAGRWMDGDEEKGRNAEDPAGGGRDHGVPPTEGLGAIIHRKLGAAQFGAYFAECEFVGSKVIAPSIARRDYIINKFLYRLPNLVVEVRETR